MRKIKDYLEAALERSPAYSYYLALANFERDFSRHGLQKLAQEADKHSQQAKGIVRTPLDQENVQLLQEHLPYLFR